MKNVNVFILFFLILYPVIGWAAQERTEYGCSFDDAGFKEVKEKSETSQQGTLRLNRKQYRFNGKEYVKDYTIIKVDPIKIWYQPKSGATGIHAGQLKAVTDYIRQALVEKLKEGYPKDARPGAGQLHLRIAITGVAHKGAAPSKSYRRNQDRGVPERIAPKRPPSAVLIKGEAREAP